VWLRNRPGGVRGVGSDDCAVKKVPGFRSRGGLRLFLPLLKEIVGDKAKEYQVWKIAISTEFSNWL
jgi:hypothetical protein